MNLDAADSLRDADFNKFGTFLRSLWQPSYQYQSPTPTWRLWGEERVPGAIFTVYLKKVRYHRPNKSVSAQEDKISHLEWETVRVRHVKAATLVKLVECLASDEGELETTYVNIFLATYRSFSTPSQVLGLLLDRYKQLSGDIEELPDCIKEQHRKTLVLSLHVWLDTYPDDFRDPPRHPALRRLTEFCREHLPNSELCVKVQHRLERLLQEHPENMCPSPIHAGLVRGEIGPNAGPNLGANTCVAVAAADHDHNLSYDFPNIDERHFAEQLTRMDMELFQRLVPHQCLGSVWSRRGEKPGGVGGLAGGAAGSVLATVNQFNAVSLRVISTMLASTQQLRSQVLTTWINIAQELRVLKNFSSLKAIVSGLQSNPVHRLRKTWGALGRDTAELFSELACIFSEENNQWAQRVLLMREGTAKFADTVGTNDRQLQKIIQKQLNNSGTISHGTIPYLGTFLTDLTMIDTAIPDTVGEEALINFDKRRKEFEVLAQIKLLQSASNAYSINPDPDFERWFNSVAVLDDREAYDISCQLEPPSAAVPSPSNHANTSLDSNKMKKRPGLGHKKNDSVASTNSGSSTSSHFYLDPPPPGDTSWRTQNSDRSGMSPSPLSSKSSSTSSLPSLDVSLGSGNTSTSGGTFPHTPESSSTRSTLQRATPEFYIIKVTVEKQGHEKDGVVMYKSIMLSNNERTPQVVRQAMLKLGLEGKPEEFSLAQMLPEKELVLPPDANVFYAVNTAHDLNFILRRQKERVTPPLPQERKQRSRSRLAITRAS